MPNAYSYIRMSTERQLKGDSLRRQLEASRIYANQHGLNLIEDDRLHDIGVSAFRGANVEHGALGRFIAAVDAGKIEKGSYLLIESFDRLSRQPVAVSLQLFLQLSSAGINVVTLTDGQLYKAGDADFVSLITSIVVMSRAHEESNTKSQRLSASWSNKRRNADTIKLTRVAPAWLVISADRKSFIVIEEKATAVRRIFEDSANGLGTYSITHRLNADGVPPIGRGRVWIQSYVTKILENRAVLGEYQPHSILSGKRQPTGSAVENYYPPIVENDLYLRAQHGRSVRRIKGSGRKGNTLSNLFSGLATCGYCGQAMRYINRGSESKGGISLQCAQTVHGLPCIKRRWKYDHFETAFLHFVSEVGFAAFLGNSGQDEQIRQLAARMATIRELIRKAESRRLRTYELMDQPNVSTNFLGQKLAECETAITALSQELSHLDAQHSELSVGNPVSESDTRELIQHMKALEPAERFGMRTRLAARLKDLISTLSLRTIGDEPDIDAALVRIREGNKVANFQRYEAKYRAFYADAETLTSPTFHVRFANGFQRTVVVDRKDPLRLLEAADYNRMGLTRLREDNKFFVLVEDLKPGASKNNGTE